MHAARSFPCEPDPPEKKRIRHVRTTSPARTSIRGAEECRDQWPATLCVSLSSRMTTKRVVQPRSFASCWEIACRQVCSHTRYVRARCTNTLIVMWGVVCVCSHFSKWAESRRNWPAENIRILLYYLVLALAVVYPVDRSVNSQITDHAWYMINWGRKPECRMQDVPFASIQCYVMDWWPVHEPCMPRNVQVTWITHLASLA